MNKRNESTTTTGASLDFHPLYSQIKDLLIQRVLRGDWRPGEMLPSEFKLAAEFKVSQGTVRKAIDALAADNLLVRRQGKGTFVTTHAEETTQFRFLRLAPDAGGTSGRQAALTRRFLDCRRLRAPAHVAQALGLAGGEAALQVRRLLHFEGRPVVFDDIWLPATLFKGLTSQRLSAYQGPMYGLFETEFGVRMIRAEEQIRAVAADPAVAALLELAPGSPLLSVMRVSFTYGDRAVEVRRGLYDTRAHHYRNQLG